MNSEVHSIGTGPWVCNLHGHASPDKDSGWRSIPVERFEVGEAIHVPQRKPPASALTGAGVEALTRLSEAATSSGSALA